MPRNDATLDSVRAAQLDVARIQRHAIRRRLATAPIRSRLRTVATFCLSAQSASADVLRLLDLELAGGELTDDVLDSFERLLCDHMAATIGVDPRHVRGVDE